MFAELHLEKKSLKHILRHTLAVSCYLWILRRRKIKCCTADKAYLLKLELTHDESSL